MSVEECVATNLKGRRNVIGAAKQTTDHRTHTPRSDQPGGGPPQRRVSCDKRPKHPMMLKCATDDVSLWWQHLRAADCSTQSCYRILVILKADDSQRR